MGRSLTSAEASQPVRSMDGLRPEMVKAGLDRTAGSGGVWASDPIGLVVEQAVIAHYGSVKAAAYALKVDPSLMQRELKAGKLGRLDDAEDAPMVKSVVAAALANAYGQPVTPDARKRHLIHVMRAALDELDQIEVA